MDLVDRLPRFARLEFLGKYQAQGRLFAAGLLAGLLLFLAWWAFQPPLGVRVGARATATGAQTSEQAIGDGGGVLDGITGAPEPGHGDAAASVDDADAGGDDTATTEGSAPGLDADGNPLPVDGDADAAFADDQGAPPPGAAQADAQADAQAGSPPPPGDAVTLVPFYVEVERGPGVSEVLRIDALSPDQALGILRDYRGNPRVLRGPSTQPLD